MSDIRKYITLLENAENNELHEGSRQKARQTIENSAYVMMLHIIKMVYMPESDSYNHWKVEVKTFINDIIKKNTRGKIKEAQVYEYLTTDLLPIQVRNKMISVIHDNYGYVTIDVEELKSLIIHVCKKLSLIIDRGTEIDYNDIDNLLTNT